ncbi:MAG: amidohydrolase family protein [Acidobacteria bacterium]|nr:amidohydrolase family protein [Acidobacteriota bacterium]
MAKFVALYGCVVLSLCAVRVHAQKTVTVPEGIVTYPDLVLYNANLVSMDDGGYNLKVGTVVQAMAVRDGRILALGKNDEILPLAGPKTDKLDLKGKTVIPGIVDSHVHIHDNALTQWLTENPQESRAAAAVFRAQGASYEELRHSVETVLKERLPGVEKGKWVFLNLPIAPDGSGKGIGTSFTLDRAMTRTDLDKLAPNHPLLVTAHPGYLVNTQAVEAVQRIYGFDPADEILEGGVAEQGVYYRRGVVIDSYLKGKRELLAGIYQKELDKWAAAGVTTFSSHIMGFDAFNAYVKLRRENRMPIRFGYSHFAGLMVNPYSASFYERLGDMAGFGDDWLWQTGVGAGSIDSGPPAICTSVDIPKEAKAREVCRLDKGKAQGEGLYAALAAGQRVAVGHSFGDKGADQFMDMVERAIAEAPGVTLESVRAHRMSTDHCGLYPRPDQIPRLKKLGMMVSCGSNMLDRMEPWLDLYGRDKAKWISPVKSLLDGGVKVVMEHEGSPTGLFAAMVPLMTRINRQGIAVAPEEAVDRVIVMKMATSWPAEFMLKEKVLGTLERGKLADFVVLNKDYFRIPMEEIATVRPLATVVNGRIVFLESQLASELKREPLGTQLDYSKKSDSME